MFERYLVIDSKICGEGDEFANDYGTLDEANKAARIQWDHLTGKEKSARHIGVYGINREDLSDWAIDDNGEIDWCAYANLNGIAGAFDSEKVI